MQLSRDASLRHFWLTSLNSDRQPAIENALALTSRPTARLMMFGGVVLVVLLLMVSVLVIRVAWVVGG